MVNKTIIQGRLVRDPEIKQTSSDVTYANFTIAWSEKYNETERKLFLDCTAWRGTAEFIEKYFSKGQEMAIEGSLETRSWQNDTGENRHKIQLNVDKVHFCGPKSDSTTADLPLPEEDDLPF